MMGMKGWMEWMGGKCTLTQTTEARGHRCPAPPDAEAGAPSAMTHHREGEVHNTWSEHKETRMEPTGFRPQCVCVPLRAMTWNGGVEPECQF